MTADQYQPRDVQCHVCLAGPGQPCRSKAPRTQGRVMTAHHSARLTAARAAWQARNADRTPATVSDAWTCPACGRSYWPPREWESELWLAARRAAQDVHAARHT